MQFNTRVVKSLLHQRAFYPCSQTVTSVRILGLTASEVSAGRRQSGLFGTGCLPRLPFTSALDICSRNGDRCLSSPASWGPRSAHGETRALAGARAMEVTVSFASGWEIKPLGD